jgi:hypothetical protein
MTIRHRATVQPGGTIEIHDPQLPDGAEAEVLITVEGQEEKSPLEDFVPDPNARPFWEEIIEIGASIPMEIWEKVPRDLAMNFNHYHYGAPKEEMVEEQPLVSFQGRGQGCFKDADEINSFLQEERESWER